jgi:thiazole synthase ThiGH ThiG subunit
MNMRESDIAIVMVAMPRRNGSGQSNSWEITPRFVIFILPNTYSAEQYAVPQ